MTDEVQEYLFDWEQIILLSKELAGGLPTDAANDKQRAYMSTDSLGLRQVEMTVDAQIPKTARNPSRTPPGQWHGYREKQAKSFIWAPASNKQVPSITATKIATNKWKVVYVPPAHFDAKIVYDKAIDHAAKRILPSYMLRKLIRRVARDHTDTPNYIGDCYNCIVKGLVETPDNPFQFVTSNRVRHFLRKYGSEEYLDKAWPGGMKEVRGRREQRANAATAEITETHSTAA